MWNIVSYFFNIYFLYLPTDSLFTTKYINVISPPLLHPFSLPHSVIKIAACLCTVLICSENANSKCHLIINGSVASGFFLSHTQINQYSTTNTGIILCHCPLCGGERGCGGYRPINLTTISHHIYHLQGNLNRHTHTHTLWVNHLTILSETQKKLEEEERRDVEVEQEKQRREKERGEEEAQTLIQHGSRLGRNTSLKVIQY